MSDQSWQRANLAAIHQRLAWLSSQADGTLHDESSPLHHIRIVKHAGQIHFYFRDPTSGALDGPMSRIALDRPLHLLAEYTQATTLALLWWPAPAHVCLIGLAGGRLSMIFHHHFPQVAVDNVDIDPAVAEIAARYFGLGFDQRQRIVMQDGRDYLAAPGSAYDTIIMDAFRDDTDNLDYLATLQFYQECKARLSRGGVLCANLLKSDALFLEKSKTFLESFRHVYVAEHKRSVVLFGNDARKLSSDTIEQKAIALQRKHGFDFPFVERAAQLKPARELAVYSARSLRDIDILRDGTIKRPGSATT